MQSQLAETHVEIAQQLQGEGAFKEAEKHFVEGGDWKGGVQMYRAAGMWEGSLRLAKAHGGALPTKQVTTSCACFPSLPFPSLPFPSLPFPSLPFPPLSPPLPSPPPLPCFTYPCCWSKLLCAVNVSACVSVCATMGSNGQSAVIVRENELTVGFCVVPICSRRQAGQKCLISNVHLLQTTCYRCQSRYHTVEAQAQPYLLKSYQDGAPAKTGNTASQRPLACMHYTIFHPVTSYPLPLHSHFMTLISQHPTFQSPRCLIPRLAGENKN